MEKFSSFPRAISEGFEKEPQAECHGTSFGEMELFCLLRVAFLVNECGIEIEVAA